MYQKKRLKSGLGVIVSLFAVFISLIALILIFIVLFERKRKDEEELERYLDSSIE
ncbi:MAG: hypothetical protein LBF33_03290 [Oscillospiraceae bacterium]|nr:hypothetical protein [Oscillospiraceae bacterium]